MLVRARGLLKQFSCDVGDKQVIMLAPYVGLTNYRTLGLVNQARLQRSD